MQNSIFNIGKGMIIAPDGVIMSPLTNPPKTYWNEIT